MKAYFENLLNSKLAKQLAHPHGVLSAHIILKKLNALNPRIIRETLKHLEIAPNQTILDVGFGGGLSFEMLKSHHNAGEQNLTMHGLEISDAAMKFVSKKFKTDVKAERLILTKASATSTPFPDEHFDHIITINTVYFFENLAPLIEELTRILKPEGSLIISIREPETLRRFKFTQTTFHFHTTKNIITECEKNGCTLSRFEHNDSLPFLCLKVRKKLTSDPQNG